MRRWGLLLTLFRSRDARKRAAWIVGIVALLYLVSPIDLLPDPILLIGWLDDLAVVGLALWEIVSVRASLKAKPKALIHAIGTR